MQTEPINKITNEQKDKVLVHITLFLNKFISKPLPDFELSV